MPLKKISNRKSKNVNNKPINIQANQCFLMQKKDNAIVAMESFHENNATLYKPANT